MKRIRGLLCLTFVLLGSTPRSEACAIIVCQESRRLFKDAKLVYEALPSSDGETFLVSHTWRGQPRDSVVVRPHYSFFDPCACGGPMDAGVGKQYLLVIDCDVPSPNTVNLFTCDAYVEPLSQASERLQFLQSARTVTRREVESTFTAWLRLGPNLCVIQDWTTEMQILADVDDWRPERDNEETFEYSAVDSAITSLSGFFLHAPPCSEAPDTVVSGLKHDVLPRIIRVLNDDSDNLEADWSAIEDALDLLGDDWSDQASASR